MQPLQSRQEVDGSRIPELKDIVSDALDRARALGATQAEADVSLQKGLTTTVRLGEVETVEYQRDRGMGVTVYFGKRKGSASTADLSPRAVVISIAAGALMLCETVTIYHLIGFALIIAGVIGTNVKPKSRQGHGMNGIRIERADG